jgi:hypothetical protein
VLDPELRTIDMICEIVEKSRGQAAIVAMDTLARRAKRA